MAATLDTLPSELLALISSNLSSFKDLQSLLQTSKNIYTAWKSNQRTILWSIGQASIPAFGDALIAARATNISKDSVLQGSLPPTPFPAQHLPGETHKPTLSETRQILSFNRLARHLCTKARNPESKRKFFLPHRWYFDSCSSWSQRTWTVWEENYHRAVYWYLTAGAMLSRAYMEPLVSEKRPSGFLENLVGILEGRRDYTHYIRLLSGSQGESSSSSSSEGRQYQFQNREQGWFTSSEKEYLQSIPLYNSQTTDTWPSAFADLEALFVQENKRLSLQTSPSQQTRPSEGLKKPLLSIYGIDGTNTQGLDKEHHSTLFSSLLQFLYLIDGDMRYMISLPGDTPSEALGSGIKDRMSVFLFGSFTLMDLTLGNTTTGNISAFAKPAISSKNNGFGFPYMHNLLKKIHDVSGLPNCYDSPIRKTPPIASFFVEYMLRKYFSLKFNYTMFDATREGGV
ncbi:hypothetical protein BDV18DRAFT_156253 [Aspergillus unguis]